MEKAANRMDDYYILAVASCLVCTFREDTIFLSMLSRGSPNRPYLVDISSATSCIATPCSQARSGTGVTCEVRQRRRLRSLRRCPWLSEVNRDGTFSVVIDGLNQPTSLEFIRKTAYVVTLGGEVWKIKGV
jgi:hypothetical protein